MNNLYPKGSEWKKWDLHIHTPKSIIQEYGGDNKTIWDTFIKKIASLPLEVKAIAITDYLFIDGYEYLLTRRDEISNIDLIMPNIEFRLNTFSGTANNKKRHNFHVIFDPSVPTQDIQDQLLNCLSKGYTITDNAEWKETPTRRSLEKLGVQVKSVAPPENSIHSKTDLEVGFDNITYDRDQILENLQKSCFKGKYLTAIGYSEWDQSRWDQSAAEKRTLINDANFCLTNLDDFLKINENIEDLRNNNLKSLVLHSSDAHEFERIGKSNLWIKADPTFGGLKQVINEPERVYIGETPPNFKHEHQIISRINIPKSNGWFSENFSLELNRDLIAIIGGRGSGKSALAEMIAYGAGSKDEDKNSFINKASQHKATIYGTKIQLKWADNSITEHEINNLKQDQKLVRYLPQNAVEQLCSPANNDVLQEQIENVIFQSLDETDKMGASTLQDLKAEILINFQLEKEQNLKEIRDTTQKIYKVTEVIDSLSEKEKNLKSKKDEIEKLNKTLPILPPEDKKGQEDLSKLLDHRKVFEVAIVKFQQDKAKFIELEGKLQLIRPKVKEFENELIELAKTLGISNLEIFKIQLDSVGILKVIEERKKEISSRLLSLKEGNKINVSEILGIKQENLLADNLQKLDDAITIKKKETKAYETVKIKYQQQKKSISDLKTSIKSLEEEIKKINTTATPQKDKLWKECLEKYFNHFEILRREKIELEKLYVSLQNILLGGTDTDRKLEFEAKFIYRHKDHLEQGLSIIDRSRKGNFREIKNLEDSISALWDTFRRGDFKKEEILNALRTLFKLFTESEGKLIRIKDQLKETYTLENFYNWFCDTSYFEIVSSIKFDGTDIYLLSPGQKGIVLLILFLEIDKEDYRPLIIDQPEENLDNLSIYNDLINFFRERKNYRQIIMVTHNPNLVVNTDAEQIIIANYDGRRNPRLGYMSGSLEDQAKKIPEVEVEKFEDGIIEQVCNILEGGERAFQNRKKKYQISNRSKI